VGIVRQSTKVELDFILFSLSLSPSPSLSLFDGQFSFIKLHHSVNSDRYLLFSINFNPGGLPSKSLSAPCTLATPVDAVDDSYNFNTALPCSTWTNLTILTNDINPYDNQITINASSIASVPTSPTFTVNATKDEPGSRAHAYIIPNCAAGSTWIGSLKFQYEVCGATYTPTRDSAMVYVFSNTGPTHTPSVTYQVPDFRNTIIPLSDFVHESSSTFPLDMSSFTFVSVPPSSFGTLSFNSTTQEITFVPSSSMPSTTMSTTVRICDRYSGSGFPTYTPRCVTSTINLEPYYVRWLLPSPTDERPVWYMYFEQLIQWASNLPNDFTLEIELRYYPSNVVVNKFTLPRQSTNGTARWAPVCCRDTQTERECVYVCMCGC
jgi:hypothetical protein